MALDTDALRLREIERGSKFSPIQFGDVARTAIGVGQQFQAGQQALADNQQSRDDSQLKRKQANDMQKLLNGGVQAVLQVMGQMPEEDQKLIFGGDKNTIESLGKDSEGLVNIWKRVAEVQAATAGQAAPTFSERTNILEKHGVITGQQALTFGKPTKGVSGISQEVQKQFNKNVTDSKKAFITENGRAANKQEVDLLINEEANKIGVTLNDPAIARSLTSSITAAAPATKAIETEKFEEERRVRSNAAVRKLGTKFTVKKRDIIIAANQVNKAIEGGVYGSKFQNLLTVEFVEGLQERLQLEGESESVIATIINSFTQGKISDDAESKRVRKIKTDPQFLALFNDPEFNKVFVSLSNLMTKVLRLESGAAITSTDIEDKKNNFGFDPLGGPGSFMIGIGNFMDALRAGTTQLINEEPDEKVRNKFKASFEGNPLASPFELPQRSTGATSLAPQVQIELDDLNADLELLK